MVMKRYSVGIALAGMLSLSLLSSGCSKKNLNSTEQPPDFAVTCVAVAPATSAAPLDSELLSQIEKKELDDGLYYLNKFLKKHFLSRQDVRLFSDGQFEDTEEAKAHRAKAEPKPPEPKPEPKKLPSKPAPKKRAIPEKPVKLSNSRRLPGNRPISP